MDYKQRNKWEKEFYPVLKTATKARKIKLSAEHDIYKKVDPYFFKTNFWLEEIENHKVRFSFHMSIKYHRFDELHHQIIDPRDPTFHFTDKIRANSLALCPAPLPGFTHTFDNDGSSESMAQLAEDMLDFLKEYSMNYIETANREYGDLNGYYIAHKEEKPLLAGLAYLDRGEREGAIECLLRVQPGNLYWAVIIRTEDQYRRAVDNGRCKYATFDEACGKYCDRNQGEQFPDYATALKNNLEWTADRAMFGLLKEEREMK